VDSEGSEGVFFPSSSAEALLEGVDSVVNTSTQFILFGGKLDSLREFFWEAEGSAGELSPVGRDGD
jgi:hypothetical protein